MTDVALPINTGHVREEGRWAGKLNRELLKQWVCVLILSSVLMTEVWVCQMILSHCTLEHEENIYCAVCHSRCYAAGTEIQRQRLSILR